MSKVARKSAKAGESLAGARPRFHEMLKEHFYKGTHPSSMSVSPDFRWKPEAFAEATRTKYGSAGVSAVTVRSYLRGDSEPVDIRIITAVLFGEDIQDEIAKRELEQAWAEAKDGRQRKTRELRRDSGVIKLSSP